MDSKKNNNLQPLLRLTRFIRPYRKEAVYALLALTSAVVFDLLIPRLVQYIVDVGIAQKDLDVVLQTSLWMLGATIIGAGLAIINSIFSIRVAQKTAKDLRAALYQKVQTFSFGDLDRFQTGQILVRLTSDVNQVQSVFLIFLRIGTRAPLLMIGSIIFLFVTSKQLAMIMLIILPLTLGLTYVFAQRLQPMFHIVQKRLDVLNTVLQENLSGIRVVKAFVRSDYEKQRFEEANVSLMDKNIQVMQWVAFLMPLLTLIINISTLAAIWYGGNLAIEGTMTVGQIIAFINYLMTTMLPIGLIAMAIGLVSAAMASANRIEEILAIQPEIQNKINAPELPKGGGHVVFKNVHFAYNGEENEAVLKNINLEAKPGETVAILGATGSGKTTLLNLIPRLYDVTAGEIQIDGLDVRSLRQEDLWEEIGIALQETVLFSGTIADNIRFGDPDAPIEVVVEAAKAAQAHDFISLLPQGYDTQVSQRGVNLSGGQKQRLAIARALLVKPRILLLDDSTSAVDVDTEARIHEALDRLMENKTRFIVAQRISTVLTADKIVVLDQGEIAAEGNHQTLLATSPIYQEIYHSQLGNGVDSDD
jgi:ATP-binding cassette subfamily B protein